MLTEIRNRATGWIAWVIVGLITIPFAFWGINSYFEGGTEQSVATIDEAKISTYDYQNALARQRQLLTQRLGRGFDPALLDSLGIKEQVVNGLISEQLFQAYTIEQNYRTSDAQLTRLITSNEAFFEEEKFSQSRYLDLLATNGLSPQAFEASQRQQAALNQLQNGLVNSAFVSQKEFDRLLSLQTQTRDVEYVVLSSDKYLDEIEISEADIQAFYDDNTDQFQTEERIKVNYIELSVDELSKAITLSDSDVEVFFEEISGRFRQPESRQASHILFAVSQSASDEDKASIKNAAELVLSQAQEGRDFAELAELYSDDPGSGNNGGDLGVIAKGQMVKPFEDAVFTMSEGDINGLIESNFGYHIIKLTKLSPARQQDLSEVRDQVESELQKRRAEEQFAEFAESFQNLVFEDPENLTTAADELDLPIQTTDWFSEFNGVGVAAEPSVRRAAFSEDVVNEGLVSQAIEVSFDHLVAVQMEEYEPAKPRELSEVKAQIESQLKTAAARNKALEDGKALIADLGERTDEQGWNTFVEGQGVDSQILAERESEVTPDLIALGSAAFSHRYPGEGEVEVGGVVLENGDYAIYGLKKVTLGDVANIDEGEKARLRNQLLSRDGGSAYYQFSEYLRDQAEVTINPELL